MTAPDTTAGMTRQEMAALAAFRELEGPIDDLSCMMLVFADILESNLIEVVDGEKRHSAKRGEVMKVLLTHDQTSMISFGWNDMLKRTSDLRAQFYAAWDAGRVSA